MTVYAADHAFVDGSVKRDVRITVKSGRIQEVVAHEPIRPPNSLLGYHFGSDTDPGPDKTPAVVAQEAVRGADGLVGYHFGSGTDQGPDGTPAVVGQEAIRGADGPVGYHSGELIRLPGLVLPGLANVHSHAFHRALRGRTHVGRGSFWTWRDLMYRVAEQLDPDRYYRLARAVYGEMALAGITAVGEFHYLHHGPGGTRYDDPNAMGHALIAAAADAGVRITLLDTLYLTSRVDGGEPEGVQRRFSDGGFDAWVDRVGRLKSGAHARIGAAAHSVRAVPARDLADLKGRHPLHVHLSEQPAENEQCRAFHGCTPAELLHRNGLLGPDTTVVHATHLTDDDIRTLGATGTGVCFCPTTERDLADGIGPARALVDAGCSLSLGSDSHAVIDQFAEAQGLEMNERLAAQRRGAFTAAELITAAANHNAIGWEDAGAIRVGNRADLVAVRLDSVRTTGSDPEQAILTAAAADVTHVIADGRPIVTDGVHTGLDVAGALREMLK